MIQIVSFVKHEILETHNKNKTIIMKLKLTRVKNQNPFLSFKPYVVSLTFC